MIKKSKNHNHKRREEKMIELIKGKPRNEEEKFFVTFSETQLNAILLVVLAATFLVQGILRYLEISDNSYLIRPWLIITLFSLVFLVSSVVLIALGGVTSPLRLKRLFNLVSFLAFMLGFFLFLGSLVFLLITV
ncbi:hypothetical protein CO038_00215 [Candidatus Pacearchaeota archaeon CG_4_9_14_0_2_um_filter_39_13]|nr:hypothetical protein [Candidatus Pacearchaeota archaeon]PJC45098.1 MAG: hypothetical protein CO038_00215 [Candidatus Pacearchaeota archaeon CG_4_9_14_0_2_um_filter_39_13]